MSDQRDGGISWTDETWNPIRGCSRVSAGCVNCYAEGIAARFSGPGLPYEGLARRKLKALQDATERLESRWTGVVRMVPGHLADPLRWKRPRRVFVNSMSDLFHEKLTNEQIAAVFGVMAAAPRHTFQVLTKRATRMREWFEWAAQADAVGDGVNACITEMFGVPEANAYLTRNDSNEGSDPGESDHLVEDPPGWPLPNVWLGVSAEDQETADERIPELLRCPAAVRWVSAEPLIGPLDLSDYLPSIIGGGRPAIPRVDADGETRFYFPCILSRIGVDWIVVGGESGRQARPFDLAWARSIVAQCKAADVPVFVKQLGDASVWPLAEAARHSFRAGRVRLKRQGGDPAEWPEDLRVREFPRSVEEVTNAGG